jgi:CxxC-x17-CxxC domain-containing protein
MKDFKKFGGGFGGNKRGGFDKRDGGRPGFKKFGGDRGFGGPKEMFRATCAECHKSCEVPFRPNGEKPVYCSDCFGGQRDGGRNDSAPRFEKRRDERSFEPRREQQSFGKSDNGNEEVKRQISDLNRKVDSILELLKQQSAPKKDTRPEEIKKIVELVSKPEKKEEKKSPKKEVKSVKPVKKEVKKDTKKKGPAKK